MALPKHAFILELGVVMNRTVSPIAWVVKQVQNRRCPAECFSFCRRFFNSINFFPAALKTWIQYCPIACDFALGRQNKLLDMSSYYLPWCHDKIFKLFWHCIVVCGVFCCCCLLVSFFFVFFRFNVFVCLLFLWYFVCLVFLLAESFFVDY
jgi:hypothetical protein